MIQKIKIKKQYFFILLHRNDKVSFCPFSFFCNYLSALISCKYPFFESETYSSCISVSALSISLCLSDPVYLFKFSYLPVQMLVFTPPFDRVFSDRPSLFVALCMHCLFAAEKPSFPVSLSPRKFPGKSSDTRISLQAYINSAILSIFW